MSIANVGEMPAVLLNQKNEDILAYLGPLSCHSDITSQIENTLIAYPDVYAFCPDGANFKYIVWYVGNTIFACAHGMHNICLRLPMPEAKKDQINGSYEGLFSNESWWSFKYDYAQLESWAEKAYKYGKNS